MNHQTPVNEGNHYDIWLSRLQFVWISYTVLYISTGSMERLRSVPLVPGSFYSSLLITIGAAIVVAIMFRTLAANSAEESSTALHIVLVPWIFFMENTVKSGDHIGFAFSCLFFLLIGWLIWMQNDSPSEKRRRQYTVFIVMLTALVCSFVQLIVTVALKHVDSSDILGRGQYYIIGYHGFGIAVGVIVSLQFGLHLLRRNLPLPGKSPVDLRSGVTAFCLIIFVLLAVGVFHANKHRMICNFGENAPWFGAAYSFVHVFVLAGLVFLVVKLRWMNNTLLLSLAILLAYPLLSSLLVSMLIWEFSTLSQGQDFLKRWLLFEFIPGVTLGLSFLLSVVLGRRLISRMVPSEP